MAKKVNLFLVNLIQSNFFVSNTSLHNIQIYPTYILTGNPRMVINRYGNNWKCLRASMSDLINPK